MDEDFTKAGSKLNELDKNEWFDVCRKLNPILTREEYEVMWNEFQKRKDDGRLPGQAN